MLIIVCGLPGSGKSSLSKDLAKRFSAVHLNSDIIRKELFPKPSYSEEEKRAVYAEMAKRAGELLAKGSNVIADATFSRKEYRETMDEVAGQTGAKVFIIKCILHEGETKKRLEKRKQAGKSPSDADYDVYVKLKETFEPLEGGYLEVDYMRPKKEVLAKVKEFIGEN
ncbi:MAG: AAA family ATPase [Candidatus ainarchaeum sp.]|nr:AAA family ATPase [Candidatus ainarchaeum sp.]